MSLAADFTPPEKASETDDGQQESGAQNEAGGSNEATFPRSNSLKVAFSAYEDRLVLRSRRVNRDPVNVLMTRRMTLIVLAQLVARLPELSGLDKTPTQYWQEVLQMAHQTALDSGRSPKSESGEPAPKDEPAAAPGVAATAQPAGTKPSGKLEGSIYLATSLTMQMKGEQLIMAFSGLPMPRAMTEICNREPLFAMPLQVEHVHQMIQLLIDKAQEANWHLPVNLPWLESPTDAPASTLGLLH